MRIGIVGAGVAGLACADRLAESGISVQLFDKGRRAGGRLSSLRLDGRAWDFGAQYFTVRDPRFANRVASLTEQGHCAPWAGGPPGALVAMPDMASLVHALAAQHAVSFDVRIEVARRSDQGWWLNGGETGFGPFDALVVALPAEQAAPLLAMHDLDLAREAVSCRSLPCWTVMAGFGGPLEGLPDYLRDNGVIAWAARNSSKPDRPPGECWVIQASPHWSLRNLDAQADSVAQQLLGEWRALGYTIPEPVFLKAHRWRFAMTTGSHEAPLWRSDLALGACGDWCAGPRIEDAWLSGARLADRMIASYLTDRSGRPDPRVVEQA